MLYLMTHLVHFIYGYMGSVTRKSIWLEIWRKEGNVLTHSVYGYIESVTRKSIWLEIWRKEGNALFNDTLGTFYLWLY